MVQWIRRFVVILGLMAALLPGARAQDVIRVADISIVPMAPFYLGIEKGYFKAAGLDVRLEKFATTVTAIAPLSTGEIQVVPGVLSPGLFNGLARGLPIKIVAPFGRDSRTNSVDAIVVRSDLKDSVKTLADLKGRKIAVVAASSSQIYMLAKALEAEGMTTKDVEIVVIPFPEQGVALANKAIDAAVSVEPFVTLVQNQGWAFLFKRAGDFPRFADPGWQVAVVMYNEQWAQKNPRAANDFMAVYLRGAREFLSARNAGANRAELVEILIRNTRVKDRALYEKMHWGDIDPNGTILKESLQDQLDWYLKQGMVDRRIDLDKFIDERYVKYALERLGRYR